MNLIVMLLRKNACVIQFILIQERAATPTKRSRDGLSSLNRQVL